MGNMERQAIAVIQILVFCLVMVFAWYGLAIAAHAVKADPLCGRACLEPGQVENPDITLIGQ